MDLVTARGAITLLQGWGALCSAYESYFAGHDDKHRNANKAYAHNHDSDDPNNPQGYYQKSVDKVVVVRHEMRSVWGTQPTLQPVFGTVKDFANITPEEEKDLLWAAVKSTTNTYYLTGGASDKFRFGCPIPAGWAGFTFEGGGRVFPKQATRVFGMVLVIETGTSNTQLVTHFPTTPTFIRSQTLLT